MVKLPGIPSGVKAPRKRGLIRTVTLPDGSLSVRQATPLGGPFYSQPRYNSAAVFAWVMWATTIACPEDRAAAEQITKGTLKLPRDVLAMAMYGTLITVTLRDGTKVYPARLVTKEVQILLDQISQNPGDMIVRGADGWMALSPGALAEVLTANGPGLLPTYQVPSGGGGGGSGYQNALAQNDPANHYNANYPCIHTWLVPQQDLKIKGLWYFQNPYAGASYEPFIAKMSGATAPATITDLTVGPAVTTGVPGYGYWQYFPMNAEVLLTAGDTFACGIVRTDAGSTGIMRHNSGANENFAAPINALSSTQAWDTKDSVAIGDTLGANSQSPKSFTMGYNWIGL